MRLPSGLEPDVFWKPRARANKSLQERVFCYVFALPFSSNSNYLAAKNFQFSSNFPASITLYCENRATFSWLANVKMHANSSKVDRHEGYEQSLIFLVDREARRVMREPAWKSPPGGRWQAMGRELFTRTFVFRSLYYPWEKMTWRATGSLTFRLCLHSHTKRDLNPCCLTVQSLPWVSCLWSDSREHGKRHFRFTDARVR